VTLQKVTVPVPDYVKHAPHATPGDKNAGVSITSTSAGVFYSNSPVEYWQSISVEWPDAACPDEHFPVNVRYRAVSADKSLSTPFSESIVLGTAPTYDIYYRFTDSVTPALLSGFPWIGPRSTSQNFLDAKRWGDADIVAATPFIQFAVCGADRTVTSLDSKTGAWDSPNYTVIPEDTQVIGVSIPTALVV